MMHATEIVGVTPARDINNTLIPDLITSSEGNALIQSDSATRIHRLGTVLIS